MISVEEAQEIIHQHIDKLFETRAVPVLQAEGTLVEEICGERDQPPFHRVAMDGIAVKLDQVESGQWIKSQEIQKAGEPKKELTDSTMCIEVMTGAPLPDGCDCVIRYEETEEVDGKFKINSSLDLQKMKNIHLQGSDFKKGDLLLSPGENVNSVRLGTIISQGVSVVETLVPKKVAIVSTGDELISPDQKEILDHQIRRSNGLTLCRELIDSGLSKDRISLFHLADKKEEILQKLKNIFEDYPIVIVSGGVSKGKFDYVPECLDELGIVKKFHKVSQRPGKPFWFGASENNTVFALPGNPVSALTCLRRYIVPAFSKKLGHTYGKLSESISFKKGLTCFRQVKVFVNDQAEVEVSPIPHNGSGDYHSLSMSDGFIELERQRDTFEKGEVFPLYLWGEKRF